MSETKEFTNQTSAGNPDGTGAAQVQNGASSGHPGALRLVLRTIIFLALLTLALTAAIRLTERKSSREKYADFRRLAPQIDVLFLGSSHVINGLDPVTLYEEYGYTAYNMGGHGSVMQATYWELMNALEYCTPKTVVIDTYMVEKNYQYLDTMADVDTGDVSASEEELMSSIEQLHLNMDQWPVSGTKLAAVRDLLSTKDLQKEFLFPFEIYHGRWDSLTGDDFRLKANTLLGAEARTGIQTGLVENEPVEGVLDRETVGTRYLQKIFDECEARGIRPVLVSVPFVGATQDDMLAAHTAGAMAQAAGITWGDLLETPGVVNVATDYNDHGHLNRSGMTAVTRALGAALAAEGLLTDHRADPAYADFGTRVTQRHVAASESARQPDQLYDELLELADAPDVDFIYYGKEGTAAMRDVQLMQLLEKLSGSTAVETAAATNCPYLLIRVGGQILEATQPLETSGVPVAGGCDLILTQGYAALYPGGDTSRNLINMDRWYDCSAQILILEMDLGDGVSGSFLEGGSGEDDIGGSGDEGVAVAGDVAGDTGHSAGIMGGDVEIAMGFRDGKTSYEVAE